MSLLELRNVSCHYGDFIAVENVSFTLQRGEMLALIGPNGAGKSTTFNMIGGQLAVTSGSIWLNGDAITNQSPRAIWRKGAGRTFQIASTFNSFTVLENIQMALLSYHGRTLNLWKNMRKQFHGQAMQLLERVGMHGQAERPCAELAYGDIKRVELAMALASRPALLLMDEPTAGMAPQERTALMALTRDVAKAQNTGVLFTEHSMDVVFGFADRILVLSRGQLIAQGDAREIRENAKVREVYFGSGLALGQAPPASYPPPSSPGQATLSTREPK